MGHPELTIWALPLGAALDALLGDPRGWPHPVRAIGWLIARLEPPFRAAADRAGGGPRALLLVGAVLTVTVVALTSTVAWGIVAGCDQLGPAAALLARVVLVYWGLAARGLYIEAVPVARAPDLDTARSALAMIVGRDTHDLEQVDVARACVETIAENTNDAVVATLFWFVVTGPAGLWAFKAASTLDSTVGYRNERYEYFGKASARLDDLMCFLPARLTWLLVSAASLATGQRAMAALCIGWRDARKHPSPNAGWSEAAMAGALGIQLGGEATYGGVPSDKPTLGDPCQSIGTNTIRTALRLMQVTAVLAVALAWSTQLALWHALERTQSAGQTAARAAAGALDAVRTRVIR